MPRIEASYGTVNGISMVVLGRLCRKLYCHALTLCVELLRGTTMHLDDGIVQSCMIFELMPRLVDSRDAPFCAHVGLEKPHNPFIHIICNRRSGLPQRQKMP